MDEKIVKYRMKVVTTRDTYLSDTVEIGAKRFKKFTSDVYEIAQESVDKSAFAQFEMPVHGVKTILMIAPVHFVSVAFTTH